MFSSLNADKFRATLIVYKVFRNWRQARLKLDRYREISIKLMNGTLSIIYMLSVQLNLLNFNAAELPINSKNSEITIFQEEVHNHNLLSICFYQMTSVLESSLRASKFRKFIAKRSSITSWRYNVYRRKEINSKVFT